MLPLALIALLVPAQAQQPQQQPARTPAGAPLHPIITEVLYAVPRGPEGDANRDGLRDALGDEFVELYNPHDKPIRLDGYTINDRNPPRQQPGLLRLPQVRTPPLAPSSSSSTA
ncbi:MAG: lamin tail domain-containing protein [Phycisphaerales bacterium]|nr:lamin tail domain-containing protein [Phycisphaerales bacterium]